MLLWWWIIWLLTPMARLRAKRRRIGDFGQWSPTADQLAQTGHFFIATTIVLALHTAGLPLWACFLGTQAWALPKEFLFDRLGPEKDSWWDGAEDWLFYSIGGIVAVAILWITN